jgi:hypothetical protein
MFMVIQGYVCSSGVPAIDIEKDNQMNKEEMGKVLSLLLVQGLDALNKYAEGLLSTCTVLASLTQSSIGSVIELEHRERVILTQHYESPFFLSGGEADDKYRGENKNHYAMLYEGAPLMQVYGAIKALTNGMNKDLYNVCKLHFIDSALFQYEQHYPRHNHGLRARPNDISAQPVCVVDPESELKLMRAGYENKDKRVFLNPIFGKPFTFYK